MRSCSSAATATSFKLFSAHCKDGGIKASSFMIHGVQSLPETQTGFLRFQLPNSISRTRFLFNPIAFASTSSNLQVELELVDEDESKLQSPDDQDDSRIIHVILQLQRECKFGEQFLVAGDHRRLGLWVPFNAVPMIWSEGHFWTAELDLPVGELIQFKFILKEITGKFLWQPGPNRVLETWETSKTISVFGDWENAAFQEVTESHELMIHEKKHQQLRMDTYSNGFPSLKCQATVSESVAYYDEFQLESETSSNKVVDGNKGLRVMNILENRREIPVSVNALNPSLIKPSEDVIANEEKVNGQIELDQKQKEEEEEGQEKKEVIFNKEYALIRHPNGVVHNNFKWWGQETLMRVLSKFGIL